jgi:hypothetical protein
MGKYFSHDGRFLRSGFESLELPSLRMCLNSVDETVEHRTARVAGAAV